MGIMVAVVTAIIIYFIVDANTLPTSRTTCSSPRGTVVTNGHLCSEIGASVLKKGGSAVEAAIAALFCEGVSIPNCMGLGGGFLMNIYSKEKGTAETLIAREVAPLGASENMFGGDTYKSTVGGLAVAVPGELKGYWEAYKKYGGKVEWADLVKPTIELCRSGIPVTKYLANTLANFRDYLYADPYLREDFIDPNTNDTYLENQNITRLRLAKTLELIAENGADVLYNGTLTKDFVQDIRDNGGIITEEDLNTYEVKWRESINITLPFNEILYTAPLPGSGVLLSFVLDILNDFLDYSDATSVTNWQRIVESFKWAYARRTELGDSDFVDIGNLVDSLTSLSYAKNIRENISDDWTSQDPGFYGAKSVQPEDHGTANVCVLAPNGDAVSVTSTINLDFGAKFMSKSTGIILNDQMDDFSSPNITSSYNIPPSPSNYIVPGKRPLSSMAPSLIVDRNGDVQLVVGAAGGTKITTTVAQIAIKNLWFNISIEDAVNEKRLHHQLFPMLITYENAFSDDMRLVDALYAIGHQYNISAPEEGFSAATAISRRGGVIQGSFDSRRTGSVTSVF